MGSAILRRVGDRWSFPRLARGRKGMNYEGAYLSLCILKAGIKVGISERKS